MATIKVTRTALVLALMACACEPEQLPPDDTPERTEPPPPYDGPQLRVELAEAPPLGPFTQGRRDDPARSHEALTRRTVMSPELAALDRELAAVLAGVERRIHERGLTVRDLGAIAGDAEAERDLLGMTDAEYLAMQNQIADILTRAKRLMPNPPTGLLSPLHRYGRGGGEQICTIDTTVEELEDGTIVITDHGTHTCEQIFTGPEPDWPVDEPEMEPDRGPGSMFTQFEQDCHDAGGVVEGGSCQCAQSRGCIAAILGATVTLPACVSVLYCAAPVGLWVAAWYLCEQRPCDAVNRHHGAP